MGTWLLSCIIRKHRLIVDSSGTVHDHLITAAAKHSILLLLHRPDRVQSLALPTPAIVVEHHIVLLLLDLLLLQLYLLLLLLLGLG